jgi:hypothetical protein
MAIIGFEAIRVLFRTNNTLSTKFNNTRNILEGLGTSTFIFPLLNSSNLKQKLMLAAGQETWVHSTN